MEITMISRQFLISLKLHNRPAYKIAQEAGLNPTTLSKLVRGIDPVRPGDPRLVAVGKILGLSPEECFVQEPEEQIASN